MITTKTRQSDGRKQKLITTCGSDNTQPHTCASSKLGDDFLIWETRIGKHYAFCHPYRDKRGASSPIRCCVVSRTRLTYLWISQERTVRSEVVNRQALNIQAFKLQFPDFSFIFTLFQLLFTVYLCIECRLL